MHAYIASSHSGEVTSAAPAVAAAAGLVRLRCITHCGLRTVCVCVCFQVGCVQRGMAEEKKRKQNREIQCDQGILYLYPIGSNYSLFRC